MKSLLIIIALLPVIIIPSLFVGFELPFYFGIALIGLVFWLYADNPYLNFIGNQMARVGFILCVVAFMYYFFSGELVSTDPFEFRFLKVLVGELAGLYWKLVYFIGSIFVPSSHT